MKAREQSIVHSQPPTARSSGSAPARESGLSGTDPHRLFVYGTLRRGFSRHLVLARLGATFDGKGSLPGELLDLGESPGARRADNPRARVRGEIYRLRNPARALQVLDEIEGYRPGWPEQSPFLRDRATVHRHNGGAVQAWVYWLNRPRGPMHRILSGDFTRR